MKNWQSTLALAALMIGLFGWLVTDIRELRSEVRADIGTLRADISTLRADVTALRERMARMEALILRSAVAEEARASEVEGAPVTPVPGSASCRLASGGEDDLAEVVAVVDELMRFHKLGQGQDGADGRLEGAVGEQGQGHFAEARHGVTQETLAG